MPRDERQPKAQDAPRSEVENAVAKATSQVAHDIIEQDSMAKRIPPTSRWRPVAAGLLGMAAIAVWLAFPPRPDDKDPRSAAVVERDLKLGVGAIASEVEGYRSQKGVLPDSLAQVPAQTEVVQYRRLDATSYELSASDGRASVVYLSSTPLAEFLAGITVGGTKP